MYFSPAQIEVSLRALKDVHPFFGFAFLGFKKFGLPVGITTPFHYSSFRELVLQPYFKPIPDFSRYYSPFRTSDPSSRWISSRYESTSLQRIVADTFEDAFLREKRGGKWGWRKDYVEQLKLLRFRYRLDPIPLGHLGVWLFRDDEWRRGDKLKDVRAQAIDEFQLSRAELEALFLPPTKEEPQDLELQRGPLELDDLLEVIGDPRPGRGLTIAGLGDMRLHGTGPAERLDYSSAPRANVVTGDNSLGKTFLLDSIWWVLTGVWVDYPAAPSDNRTTKSPVIEASFKSRTRSTARVTLSARYDTSRRGWIRSGKTPTLEGVGVYVLSDGRFAIWDSERLGFKAENGDGPNREPYIAMTHAQALEGLEMPEGRKTRRVICNGLIQDLITWNLSAETYGDRMESFRAAIETLSAMNYLESGTGRTADSVDVLRLGRPSRLPGDSRDMPTLEMPYGRVPIVYASAGVQRILTIAYLMVWAWHEHLDRLRELGKRRTANLVILVDEIEAHLHPKWQRAILPSLIEVAEALSEHGSVQLHVATHSPIVMTSVEPILVEDTDRLHHLKLEGGEVELEELSISNRGSVNDWLQSAVFDGLAPWSREAEIAMRRANELMGTEDPETDEVEKVNQQLVDVLPDVHPFWARWRAFAHHLIGEDNL